MKLRIRNVVLAGAIGALPLAAAGAAAADDEPVVSAQPLPVVECIDGVATVPADTAWATYGMINNGAAVGVVWDLAVGGDPVDANGWERYFSEMGALLLQWDLDVNGCTPDEVETVTPAAPTYWGTTSPEWVLLDIPSGYHYEVDGQAVDTRVAISPGQSVTVTAVPEAGYELASGAVAQWAFTGVPSVVFPTDISATFYCDHTYELQWTDGTGHTGATTYEARGWGSGVWSPMPEDATEWVEGDYVAVSLNAAEGYGVYEAYLAEGWVIDGWGDGSGYLASYQVPFTGACVEVDDGDGDDGAGGERAESGNDGSQQESGNTGESKESSQDTQDRLPESGVDQAIQASAAGGLITAGAGVMALRQRLERA